MASKVMARGRVKAYVKELFRAVKKSDLLSGPEWLAGAIADLEHARADNNHTAVASMQRVIAQGIGQLSEHLSLTDERPTAETLVQVLAQDDPALAEMLRRKLSGRSDFDA